MAFSDTFFLLGSGLILALAASLMLEKADASNAGGAHQPRAPLPHAYLIL